MQNKNYDYIIIGAGVAGTSIAYRLSQQKGKTVLVIDKNGFRNNVNASQDYSRSFRVHYDQDEFLIHLASDTLKLWNQLESNSGKRILHPTGKLLLGDNSGSYAERSFEKLRELGLPAVHYNRQELTGRYPQFNANHATLDQSGHLIDAYAAVEAFVNLSKVNGATYLEGKSVKEVQSRKVVLEDGSTYNGQQVIVATGAWTKNLINIPVRATQQHLLYLKPYNLERYLKINFPVFSYMEKGFYGLPAHGLGAMKIANHIPGPEGNPDTSKRLVTQDFKEASRAFFAEHIPGLVNAPIETEKSLFYTLTPDRNFIIDRLEDGVWIATGFSGHGFKFGPMIGQLVEELINNQSSNEKQKRFGLSRLTVNNRNDESQFSL